MRVPGTVMGSVMCAWLLAACGGGGTPPVAEPAGGNGGEVAAPEDEEETSPDSGNVISPETYDEMRLFFNSKRKVVEKCYSNAVNSGKLDKKAGGTVTFTVDVSKAGKASQVQITDSGLKSDDVESCIATMIRGWDLPAPENQFQFSYSYSFIGE